MDKSPTAGDRTPQGRRESLTRWVIFGMAAGIMTGLALHGSGLAEFPLVREYFIDGVLHILGQVFFRALQMLVVPVVFVSLVSGTCNLEDLGKLGRLGARTVGFYLATTALAISLALGLALVFRPGAALEQGTHLSFQPPSAPDLGQVLIEIIPTNIYRAFQNADMLSIILFAILFGIALGRSGDPGRRLGALFGDLNAVLLRLVRLVMLYAPIGVFALLARNFADLGWSGVGPIASYFVLLLAVLLLHGLFVYPTLLHLLGRLNPRPFLLKMREVWLYAFSTSSSNATIPVTLRVCEERLGVSNRVASFTVPLGATINMDGTAIMQGIATVFIAQAYGVELHLSELLLVVLTATLASIGTAGVPGIGLITLAMVLRQVELPVEGIALIIGVDRLLDMVRTCVNVTGDAVVTCIVGRAEGALDDAVFNDPAPE